MANEKKKDLEIRSYEESIILTVNINPVHLINPHSAIVEKGFVKFRSLLRFLEKQMKTRKNDEFLKIISILKAVENANGELLNISTTNTYDSLYIRIAFDNLDSLQKFDNALKELY